MDGHKLIEARFSDSNHLNVMTLWKDKDNNVVEQLISADPTQSQWQQLMKHTNEKAVWDRTAEWKIEEKRKFDAYIEPLVEKAIRIVEDLGATTMTPQETREKLKLVKHK